MESKPDLDSFIGAVIAVVFAFVIAMIVLIK